MEDIAVKLVVTVYLVGGSGICHEYDMPETGSELKN